MKVRTLGRIGSAAMASDEGPPSSQAILALYRGEPGALGKVVGSTMLRAALVSPGVLAAAYVGGARGLRLAGATVLGSLLASLGITAFLAGYYALRGVGPGTQAQPTVPPGPEAREAVDAQTAAAIAAQTAAQTSAPTAGLGTAFH